MKKIFILILLFICNNSFVMSEACHLDDKIIKCQLEIENHKFYPDKLTIPIGYRVKLNVINKDPTPEEFESEDLMREKLVSGNSAIIVSLGALKKGEYKFFGEFNQATAQGLIIAE